MYYIASSLDGFIADPSGDFSRFPTEPESLSALFERYPETCPAHLRSALGVTGRPRRFDTVIMGSRTFEPARLAGLTDGAYPHLRQIVATHRDLDTSPAVEIMTGDLADQVAELKSTEGRDIWLCGGGELAAQLVDEIDEIQLKINPVILGRGIPLFAGQVTRDLQWESTTDVPGGVMLVTLTAIADLPRGEQVNIPGVTG